MYVPRIVITSGEPSGIGPDACVSLAQSDWRADIVVAADRELLAATAEALKFFAWAFHNGSEMAEELDYVPMPKTVVKEIEKVWASQIKDTSGKPLFVAMAQ